MPTYCVGDKFNQHIENNDDFNGIVYRITGRTHEIKNTFVHNALYNPLSDELLYTYTDDRYPHKIMTITEHGINKMISSGMWKKSIPTPELHNTDRLGDVDF